MVEFFKSLKEKKNPVQTCQCQTLNEPFNMPKKDTTSGKVWESFKSPELHSYFLNLISSALKSLGKWIPFKSTQCTENTTWIV